MKKNNINKGTFLLSIPLIEDERFDKTIIIITESLKDEKIGFVINKKTNLKVIDLIKKIKNHSIIANYGGPVCPENLFYFHKKTPHLCLVWWLDVHPSDAIGICQFKQHALRATLRCQK